VNAETTEKGQAGFSWAMWLAILLPPTYVLSTGPVCKVAEKLGVGADAVHIVYAPLVWLYHHTPARQPLEWYLDLWGVK
jgi:hypothetical protein